MFRAFPFRCPETGTPFRGTARTRRLLLCTAVLATLLGSAAAARAQTSQNVYATAKSPAGPTHVSGFAKDAATGTLSVLPGSPYDERLDGAAMVVDVLGRFLFIANPTNNDISMFQIDSSTGALTEVPDSPFATGPFLSDLAPTSPIALAAESSGQYLYVGYRNGSFAGNGAVNSYRIDAQQLALVPTLQMGVEISSASPFAVLSDARGRNVYAGLGPPGPEDPSAIETYQIDPSSGSLSLASTVAISQLGRSMAIDQASRFLYLGSGKNQGAIDGWQLSPVDSLPTSAIAGRIVLDMAEFPLAMTLESSGKYLYVRTNQGGGATHIYSVDETSGDLTEMQGSPQESLLSALFVADPQGPYLYSLDAAGIHAFEIDLQTGLLTEIAGSPFALPANNGVRGIAITSTASGTPISGPFPQFDTDQVTFPDTVVGMTSDTITDRLVNNGQQALLINSITISGANPGDFSVIHNCPVSLSPGVHCTLSVTFAPLAAGLRQASLEVASNGPGSPHSVSLSGTGLAPQPAVTLVPGSLSFATILAGSTSSPQNVTVTNAGNTTLEISSVLLSGPNPQDFNVSNGCTAPVPVAGSCILAVTFAPLAAGQRTAQIVITDNAPDSPQTVLLTSNATDPYTISASPSGSPLRRKIRTLAKKARARHPTRAPLMLSAAGEVAYSRSRVFKRKFIEANAPPAARVRQPPEGFLVVRPRGAPRNDRHRREPSLRSG